MLFDLQSGKRRRVVQVVYTLLALSFLIGFVIFGVGSGGVGGIGDIFSGGGDSGNAAASAYQDQIDQAEKQLKQDPTDAAALIDLARYRYLTGVSQGDQDPNSLQVVPSEDTLNEWNLALDAWEKYLKVAKDPLAERSAQQVTQQMVQAYQAVGDAEGAARTQQLVVEKQPSAQSYALLSYFLYSAGKLDAGKQAADKSVSLASGKERKKLQGALDKLAEQAKAQQTAAKAQSSAGGGGGGLTNPFGGLDPGSQPLPGTTP